MDNNQSIKDFKICVIGKKVVSLQIETNKTISDLKYKLELAIGIPYDLQELSIKKDNSSKQLIDWLGIHTYSDEDKINVEVPTKWNNIVSKLIDNEATLEEVEQYVESLQEEANQLQHTDYEDDEDDIDKVLDIFFTLFIYILNATHSLQYVVIEKYFPMISFKRTYTNRNLCQAVCYSAKTSVLKKLLAVHEETVKSLLNSKDDYGTTAIDIATATSNVDLINVTARFSNYTHIRIEHGSNTNCETLASNEISDNTLLSREKISSNLLSESPIKSQRPVTPARVNFNISSVSPLCDFQSQSSYQFPCLQVPSVPKVRRISQFRPSPLTKTPFNIDETISENEVVETGRGLQQLVKVERWRTSQKTDTGKTRRITIAGCSEEQFAELEMLKEELSIVEESKVQIDEKTSTPAEEKRLAKPWNAWKPAYRKFNSLPNQNSNNEDQNRKQNTFEEWLAKKMIEEKNNCKDHQKVLDAPVKNVELRESFYNQWMNETLKKKDEVKRKEKHAEIEKVKTEKERKSEKQKTAKENYDAWLQQKYEKELQEEEEKFKLLSSSGKNKSKKINKKLPKI